MEIKIGGTAFNRKDRWLQVIDIIRNIRSTLCWPTCFCRFLIFLALLFDVLCVGVMVKGKAYRELGVNMNMCKKKSG